MEEVQALINENIDFQCYICGLCDLKFANQTDLDLHNQLHDGTGGFSCPLCKVVLPDMHQLQLHDLQHSLAEAQEDINSLGDFDIFGQSSTTSICIMCGEGFSTEEELFIHCSLHAEVVNDGEEIIVDIEKENGAEESIQMKSYSNIVMAKKTFHRPSRPVSRRPPPSFERDKAIRVLSENSFQLKRQNYLMAEEDLYYLTRVDDEEGLEVQIPTTKRRRSRTATHAPNRNMCEQCKRKFSNSFSLKRHKSSIHLNKRPYVCIWCRKTFLHMSMLLRHTNHHHLKNEDPFTCKHCEEEFDERGLLQHHIQMAHDMKFTCEACFKFFAEKENHVSHMREHLATFGFDCCRCRRRYKSSDELQNHKCIPEKSKQYMCKICLKRFHRKYHLTRHFRVHQTFDGDLVDYAVKIERDSEGEVEEPIQLKPRDKNKIKHPKYDNIIHYKNGRRTMLRKKMNFQCYICNMKWPNLRRYKQHFAMAHNGVKFNSCPKCGKQFSTAYRVRRHLSCHDIPEVTNETKRYGKFGKANATGSYNVPRITDVVSVANCAVFPYLEDVHDNSDLENEDNIHVRGRNYKCYICLKMCDNLRRFKLHFKAQHKNVEFNSCHICSKQFPNTYRVRQHLVSHYVQANKELQSGGTQGNIQDDSRTAVLQQNPILSNFEFINTYGRGVPKTYLCYVCNKNCHNYLRYKEHFFAEHKDIELNACHICNKQFSTTSKVKRHIQTHLNYRKFRCHACSKRFAQFAHLKRHRALMHTVRSQRLNKCMYCPKLYADKNSFDKHILMHKLAEQSNFKCTVCQEKFVEEKLLDEHILAFHDFFKKYQCTVCRRRFDRESYLSRHMMTHSGLRKWKCFKCNKRFVTKSDLTRHSLTHTDLKPFPCLFCDKCFTRHSNRQKHMLLFHNIRDVDHEEIDIKPFQDLTEKQKMILMTFN